MSDSNLTSHLKVLGGGPYVRGRRELAATCVEFDRRRRKWWQIIHWWVPLPSTSVINTEAAVVSKNSYPKESKFFKRNHHSQVQRLLYYAYACTQQEKLVKRIRTIHRLIEKTERRAMEMEPHKGREGGPAFCTCTKLSIHH